MNGFNVYLKAGSRSCQVTLATVTGNDSRQGVKEMSNFLMSAVIEIHIICYHMRIIIDVPSHTYDTCHRKLSIPFNEE